MQDPRSWHRHRNIPSKQITSSIKIDKTATRTYAILNINFQSLRKKGNLLEALIESSKPDIILGTETWLDSSIKSSEILPPYLNYDIERRDRPSDPHGGVLAWSSIFSFLSNVLYIIVCPFSFLLLTIVLSVLLRCTASNYSLLVSSSFTKKCSSIKRTIEYY